MKFKKVPHHPEYIAENGAIVFFERVSAPPYGYRVLILDSNRNVTHKGWMIHNKENGWVPSPKMAEWYYDSLVNDKKSMSAAVPCKITASEFVNALNEDQ